MATLTPNNLTSGQSTTIAVADLSADTNEAVITAWEERDVLVLRNGEASASLTVVISGDNVASVNWPGTGDQDLSAGFSVVVPNGDQPVSVNLNAIRNYLGTTGNRVTVTTTNATTGNSFGYLIRNS